MTRRSKPVFGLFGAGGFGREVMPLVAEMARQDRTLAHRLYFVEVSPDRAEINGYPVVSEAEFFALACSERYFNVALGDSKARERIAKDCLSKGARPMTVRSTNALVYDGNEIGEGAVLCAHTLVTSNARIGKFFQSNLHSYVAHDCVIGDYVTFAPSVHCNGYVHVHDRVYVGTGALIRPGSASKPLVIGEGAVVGMGAVVTKDVAPFTTVVGNPAKPRDAA